ncbi:NAD(P)/FAD-dependent oxidoreductase [Streptomyces corynorhini]|uniref:Pyridine nucleotide-disulfide oxidoreductase n=1 Tax=Streptomyces corynorhini TaxID=2282652 RepID=A0A370B227_9ACTN|nr:FAD-dependent oxidoreductase [Streptomyces corynorhini]RDG35641.1 pyridine nucleotide-disulfide oxidoreductase [Streptomyces corynorhini]
MKSHENLTGKHVVVVGAGYAGLHAALRLAPHVRVTLIAPDGHFTERVRLHERAAGRPDVTHPLRELLGPAGVTHVAARVTRIDTGAARVHTDAGPVIGYDRLVCALGSRTAEATAAEGAAGRLYTAESAPELRKRLLGGAGALTVVGGGLTGVELAAELAEFHSGWQVGLVTGGEIAPSVSAKGRAHVRSALRERGVRIEEGRRVADHGDLDAEVVVWSAALVPHTELAVAAGIAVDEDGRIAVDSALRSVSHPDVYAAGDAASVRTPAAGRLRMACATALPLGAHVATAVVRDLSGREPEPVSFGYLLQCVSLGRHDGIVQPVRADDTPRGAVLTGRPAALVKERIVRSTVWALRTAARHPRLAGHVPGMG